MHTNSVTTTATTNLTLGPKPLQTNIGLGKFSLRKDPRYMVQAEKLGAHMATCLYKCAINTFQLNLTNFNFKTAF